MSGTPRSVIGILGLNHAGSTLLNLLLDSHPQIFGAGELFYLSDEERRNADFDLVCTNCLDRCPVWAPDFLAGLDPHSVYGQLARRVGLEILVDSSKRPWWFEQREESEPHVSMFYVLIVKHPVRQIASLHCQAESVSGRRWWTSPNDAAAFVVESLEMIEAFLSSRGRAYEVVCYEDVVRDLPTVLGRILGRVGERYSPEIKHFEALAHHQLAGNDGAVYTTTGRWNDWNPSQPVHPIRRKQYERQRHSGLSLDNKYREILTPEEISAILIHRPLAEVMRRLGLELESGEEGLW